MTRLLALAALLLAACDDDSVDPITKITAPRILAITTEPSALPVDGQVALTIVTVDRDGPRSDSAVRVRACAPWKFITDPARDCAGTDALPLALDGDGRIAMDAAQLAAAFPSPPNVPAPPDPWRAALAAGLALRVPIIAEVDAGGQTLIARREVDVVEPTLARRNPALAEIRFDGIATRTLRAGQRYVLTATFDRDSLDESPDTLGTIETVTCHFYSPTGELSEAEVEVEVDAPDALVLETSPNTYTAGPPGMTWLFVVARDETGGMSAASIPLTIE